MPKIPEYDSLSTPNDNDLLVIEDTVASNTKNITREAFLAGAPLPQSISFADGGGVYTNTEYFTSSGTYSKPAGLKFVVVEVQGGGGAGGGVPATTSGQRALGAGGISGVYARSKILASSLGTNETVTVGAGGTGVSGGNGGNGGNSSFGSLVSANGGTGGEGAAFASTTLAFAMADPITTGTGDFIVPGRVGPVAFCMADSSNAGSGGQGGSSVFGAGGAGRRLNTAGAGGNASGYGAGGGGTGTSSSQSARTGGNGSPGIVIVHEYF